MKIWHIGDTHGNHGDLTVPVVDMVVHSGDATNWRDPARNNNEMLDFLDWFGALDIKHKVYVAGNHDSAIESRLVTPDDLRGRGVVYLENEGTEIEGLKLWGSPFTPEFNQWSFNKSRNKLDRFWKKMIPDEVDILITHGPPKHILDLTINRLGKVEMVGDKSLLNRVREVRPQAHLFGHVHNYKGIQNAGVYVDPETGVFYSNASCVTDGEMDRLSSDGHLLEFANGALATIFAKRIY